MKDLRLLLPDGKTRDAKDINFEMIAMLFGHCGFYARSSIGFD